MIALWFGLPGSGKGVYTVMKGIEELRTTERPIITNFAFELHPWRRKLGRRRSRGEKGLLAHLEDTYGETYEAASRIHVLPDEHIAEFYLWRVNHEGKLIHIDAKRDRDGTILEIPAEQWSNTRPCHYIVDEAWKFWNSRAWQKIDKGFQFYNAQHRKAGDDLSITVQAPSQVDKQLRVLVQEYHSLVNHKHRRMAIFKQPNVISVITSNEPPEVGRKSISVMPKLIRFDPAGIGGCFDTAKGAGVQGQGADIERKTKGLPWWGIILAIIVLGASLILVARGSGWFAGKLLTGQVGSNVTKSVNQITTPQWGVAPVARGGETNVATLQRYEPEILKQPEVYMSGYAWIPELHIPGRGYPSTHVPAHWMVSLTDGRTLSSLDKKFDTLTKEFVQYEGKKYYQQTTKAGLEGHYNPFGGGRANPVGVSSGQGQPPANSNLGPTSNRERPFVL